MQVFHGLFHNVEDVWNEYDVSEQEQRGIDFIWADYEYQDYSGNSFIVFVKNGMLYEVNGGHCSWGPEETNLTVLLSRPNVPDAAKDNLREYYKELIAFV